MPKCPHCKGETAKWPVKGQSDKTFSENWKEGTIIWKNMFRMDLVAVLLLIGIISMSIGYSIDTKLCREIQEDPCEVFKELECPTTEIPIQSAEDFTIKPIEGGD